MKVVGRVWIRRPGIYIVFFIRVRDGEWLKTNNTTIQAKRNRLHKKFNLSRNFKQWATKIIDTISELPIPKESNWQKEWEVEDRQIKRMFGKSKFKAVESLTPR